MFIRRKSAVQLQGGTRKEDMEKFDRSTMLWFIDQNIDRFRNEIDTAQKGLVAMMAIRDIVTSAGAKEKPPMVYSVPSRSGGDPHTIIFDGDVVKCDCKAGQNGISCWAMKGLMEKKARTDDLPTMGLFYDSEGWPHAYRLLTTGK